MQVQKIRSNKIADNQILKNYVTKKQNTISKYENIFIKDLDINLNSKNLMNGLELLKNIKEEVITAVFFDPQYRGIMEKMKYGNEGSRQKQRYELSQMSEKDIRNFISQISRVLKKSGHLFLWVDKFHLCEGVRNWIKKTDLNIVDLVVWNKEKMGMGYRTRRQCEYLIILQKKPNKVKDVWLKHNIRDIWSEKIVNKIHTHQKPLELQKELIEAVSKKGDYIIDPCAGSYVILEACKSLNRTFIGCDLKEV